jgi:hypothetical protein
VGGRGDNLWWLLGGLGAAVALWWYSTQTQSGQDATASAADSVGSTVDAVTESVRTVLSGPRGIRNNNPGNIKRNAIDWQGALSVDQVNALGWTFDPTFVQFDTPASGVRAMGHILSSYAARGLNTVAAVISTWSATDQGAYIANVSRALGVDPTQQIDVRANLQGFALAIIQQENGQQPYNPDDVGNWVYL